MSTNNNNNANYRGASKKQTDTPNIINQFQRPFDRRNADQLLTFTSNNSTTNSSITIGNYTWLQWLTSFITAHALLYRTTTFITAIHLIPLYTYQIILIKMERKREVIGNKIPHRQTQTPHQLLLWQQHIREKLPIDHQQTDKQQTRLLWKEPISLNGINVQEFNIIVLIFHPSFHLNYLFSTSLSNSARTTHKLQWHWLETVQWTISWTRQRMVFTGWIWSTVWWINKYNSSTTG